MTRSDLHKKKYERKHQLPKDDIMDGSSARTRPFSIDDIMIRRRNKGDQAEKNSIAHGVGEFVSAQESIDLSKDHQQINHDSENMDEKRISNYSQKARSERKEKTYSSRKNDMLVQVNNEGSLDPRTKSKHKRVKNSSANVVSVGTYMREDHGNSKEVGHLSIDSVDGPHKSKDRVPYKKDIHSERCRVKSEIVINQQPSEERKVNRKRKPNDQMSSDSDTEYKKRNVKYERQAEKSTSRGREKPKKETRHKRHHDEEDKTRGRVIEKKKGKNKKCLDQESGQKRRQSQSRVHEKDRGRRSHSHSPNPHKHTSKDVDDFQPSHSTKDRSGREHSDADEKRTSNNGLDSHYKKNTNSLSGLGGYSPRKRKTEAAARTPSPTRHSPERRNAGWYFQHVEKESNLAGSTVSYMNTACQSLLLNLKELPIASPVTTTAVKPIVPLQTISSQMHAIEAIQLTQATRPMRRLYVENLPASASEEDLKKFINKILLSSGFNYVQGTQPCISSIIHKEKNQGLLEFLTPEDASAALSLDGMPLSGSSLKIRRPKDYAIVTTGLSDKSVGTVDSVSDIVEDSPNKIFIGGISRLYSSKMLLDIARAFGAVKSFHFEFIADINEPCAFLEYVDHSVTLKACAGLNGMRLGGQVLTALLATTPESVLESVGELPIYGIPAHVKPLLKKPTTVIKLNNVLDPECLHSLTESEVEEILEDIKLECSRFGAVKSINIVKNTNASDDARNFELANTSTGGKLTGSNESEPLEGSNELEINCQTLEDKNDWDDSGGISDKTTEGNITRDVPPINGDDPVEDFENPVALTGEVNNQLKASGIEVEGKHEAKLASSIEHELKKEARYDYLTGDAKDSSLGDIGQVGCVYVEYRREEAACMAAHCLHGRTFDGRIVTVDYVGRDNQPDLY